MFNLYHDDSLFEYGSGGLSNLQDLYRSIDSHLGNTQRKPVRCQTFYCDSSPAETIRSVSKRLEDLKVEVRSYEDHYAVEMNREIRRGPKDYNRKLKGSFGLIPLDDHSWCTVTAFNQDFFDRGVKWLLRRAEPNITRLFHGSVNLAENVIAFQDILNTHITVEKAIFYNQRSEGKISFESQPINRVTKTLSDNDVYLDKIKIHTAISDDEEFEAFLSRSGETRFLKGKSKKFFDILLPIYLDESVDVAESLSGRERKKSTSESFDGDDITSLVLEFPRDIFKNQDDINNFLHSISELPKSDIAIYHRNPYAHISWLDQIDGSSADILIEDTDRISLYPSFRSTTNSLLRFADYVGRVLTDANIKINENLH